MQQKVFLKLTSCSPFLRKLLEDVFRELFKKKITWVLETHGSRKMKSIPRIMV